MLLIVFALLVPIGAADEIELRSLDGVPVIRVDLSTAEASAPCHAILDLGVRAPVLIHDRTAALLGIRERGPINMTFPATGCTWLGVDSVSRPLEPLEDLTREHAGELDSLPLALVLGLPAFADRYVVLDLGGGRVLISDADPALPELAAATPLPLQAEAYGYWLTATTPAGDTLRVQFTTRERDTRINAETAQRLGHAGGDMTTLMLGPIDLMRYAVLRPSDVSTFPEPRPDIILGTDFLRHFLVAVAPDQRSVALVPVREPHLALQERAFFVARAAHDLAGIEQFLTDHPESRLTLEAAQALFWMNLEADTPDAARTKRAVQWWLDGLPAHRRASGMVALADELIALEDERADALDLAMLAIDAGRAHVSDDDDAIAVHQLNARAGLIALLRKDYPTARRLLLGALFGMPLDKSVNLWMGRLYEETDQPLRAWSRYVVSAMQDKPPIGALRGLDRLTENRDFRRGFSMERAALLLEGRIPAFATRERLDPSKPVAPPLVEVFTNTSDPETLAGQLAFEGLASYLASASPVCAEYHLHDVLADPVHQQRAAELGVDTLAAIYVNGQGPVIVRGDEADTLDGFTAARDLALANTKANADVTLGGQASWNDDRLHVTITAQTTVPHDVQIVALLRERLVFAPGPNARLLHHDVVRAAVSPTGGWTLTPSPNKQTFKAELALDDVMNQRKKSLSEFDANVGGRSAVRPVLIDPRLTDVICYARDAASGAILGAVVIVPPKETP